MASALFLLLVGEPALDEAIRLEQAASAGHGAEVFSRSEQHLGMVLASGLYGLAIGGIVGLILFVAGRWMSGGAWERSMKLALAGFGVWFLVPFLKYPASPPGVGDPDTIGLRTAGYLFLLLVSLAACAGAVVVARRLAGRGVERHHRHLLVGAGYLLVIGTAFAALPDAPAPDGVPSGLLWEFRLASIGGQAVLWLGIGAILGLLNLRAERRSAPVTDTDQEV